MILGIDASNIRSGGGVTHLVELLRAATPADQGFERVVVWSGTATLAQIEDRPWLVKAHLPVLDRGLPHRMWWQRFHLSSLAHKAGCDLLFIPGGSYAGGFRPMATMSQNLLPFEWAELRRFGWSVMTMKWLALRRTQSATFRHADGVIFLTRYARDTVLGVTGALSCPTAVVPHGVRGVFDGPPRAQEPVGQYSSSRPFRILYVSIVDMYKHQWNVAEAAAQLRQSGLPVVLDLVGPSYPPALTRLKRAMAMHDPGGTCVRFLGPVPYEQMHLLYREANVSVFASSCETFGQILTESMSAGVPVACSNRSAMPELLRDAGVYFDPEDPADIARAIRQLVESPELRAQKARAAYALAQEYSWKRCADDTLGFLRDVAGTP